MADINAHLLSARRASACPDCRSQILPGALIVQHAPNEPFICHSCARPFLERLITDDDQSSLPSNVTDLDFTEELRRLCEADHPTVETGAQRSSTDIDVGGSSPLELGV